MSQGEKDKSPELEFGVTEECPVETPASSRLGCGYFMASRKKPAMMSATQGRGQRCLRAKP
jgi:hypothetical protein